MGRDRTDESTTEIAVDECMRLLATARVGRIALTQHALPVVVPVNFALDGPDVVVRTLPESLLTATHDRDVVVAFQVDELDPQTMAGWTVLVRGTMREITEVGARLRAGQMGLAPDEPGERSHYVRITPGLVTGRRTAERGMVEGRTVTGPTPAVPAAGR